MTERTDDLYSIPDVVYITITNSYDSLSQQRWADLLTDVSFMVAEAGRSFGEWHSSPLDPRQSACFAVFAVKPARLPWLRDNLQETVTRYDLEGIGWSESSVQFLRRAGVP